MKKAGFSIIELIVVMALMALVFALAISGIIILSNYNTSDRAAEELILNLRDAQNRSIAVTPDPGTGILPIAWGIHLNTTNGLELLNIIDKTPTSAPTLQKNISNQNDVNTIKMMTQISVKVINPDNSVLTPAPTDIYLFNSAPYGKFYAANIDCLPPNDTSCGWDKNSLRPYDFTLSSDAATPNSEVFNGARIEITLDYKGQSRKITIEANGDISGSF